VDIAASWSVICSLISAGLDDPQSWIPFCLLASGLVIIFLNALIISCVETELVKFEIEPANLIRSSKPESYPDAGGLLKDLLHK